MRLAATTFALAFGLAPVAWAHGDSIEDGKQKASPQLSAYADEELGASDDAVEETEDAADQAYEVADEDVIEDEAYDVNDEAIESDLEEAEEEIDELGEETGEIGSEIEEDAEEAGEEVDEEAEDFGDKVEHAAEDVEEAVKEEKEPRVFLGQKGMDVSAGVGITGFSNNEASEAIETGPSYTARVALGTEQPLGFEVGYIGAVQDADTLGLDDDALMVSNGLEAAVRYNLGLDVWRPYVLAGAAWRHYTLTGEDFNTSDVNDTDDVLEVPIAGGLAWHRDNFNVDGRLAYRLATDEDLLGGGGGGGPGLDAWDFSVRAGIAF